MAVIAGVALFVAGWTGDAQTPESTLSTERLQHIASVQQPDIDDGIVPGYVTLVAQNGKIVYFEAQGWADVERQIPLRRDSLFRLVDQLAEYPLAFQPGSAYEYGYGIGVAGVIVERVSGMSLDQFFAERIFKPLGMNDSSFYVPPDRAYRLATLYLPTPDGQGGLSLEPTNLYTSDKINGPPVQFGGDGWGGGVVSSAEDYFRFAQMLLNGGELHGKRIISRESVEMMTANQTGDLELPGTRDYRGHVWGLGLSVLENLSESPGIRSVGSFGWHGAGFTKFFVDPTEGIVAVRLSQMLGGATVERSSEDIFSTLIYGALDD